MATATVKNPLASVETLADLLKRLGNVPPQRIRLHPLPGRATERDLLALYQSPNKRFFELVDGVLVEKAMGVKASYIAVLLAHYLFSFVEKSDTDGLVLGPDGFVRLKPGRVRIPDVAFIAAHRLPGGDIPDEAILSIIPDLAVEVLSPGNTKKEIDRKVREFFEAGVRLVWVIDPKKATVDVNTSVTDCTHLSVTNTLDGGEVLPGFSLPLRKLLARKPPKKFRQ